MDKALYRESLVASSQPVFHFRVRHSPLSSVLTGGPYIPARPLTALAMIALGLAGGGFTSWSDGVEFTTALSGTLSHEAAPWEQWVERADAQPGGAMNSLQDKTCARL